MQLKTGKLNYFYIDGEFRGKYGYGITVLTDATESEFKELLENYLAENPDRDGKKFDHNKFAVYMAENGGFYHKIERDDIVPPFLE